MTDHVEKNLRSFCAHLLREHGIQFSPDNPIIPSLYVFHKDMELTIQANKAIASQIHEAASRINPKVFNFNNSGEAWKFQMGIAVKWILIGGLVLLFIWVSVWRWSMSNDVDKAERILKEAEQMHELFGRAKRDKAGVYFMDIIEARQGAIHPFMKYRRLNDSTVRIHLGK
jgi:hypothetical protein